MYNRCNKSDIIIMLPSFGKFFIFIFYLFIFILFYFNQLCFIISDTVMKLVKKVLNVEDETQETEKSK